MILQVVRTSLIKLRRDRAAMVLSFILPIVFFTIFAGIFAGGRSGNRTTPRIRVAIADLDQSEASRKLVTALQNEKGLNVKLPFDAAGAEAAVRKGDVTVAILIPRGFGANPIAFSPDAQGKPIEILADSSDPVAPPMITGLLQKVVMTSMPTSMVRAGFQEMDRWIGVTDEQRQRMETALGQIQTGPATDGGLVQTKVRDVLGETKKNPVIAFYAAGVGVMFLLFTTSAAGGTLLEESESGTLDRVLSTRVSMTSLLFGNLIFLSLIGIAQLTLMFVWGALLFRVELIEHFAGFAIMTLVTALAASAFGLLLASVCRTRAQLSAAATLTILVISAIGGSMFPRFLMPEAVQKFSLIAFNSWALEGFLKVFWREAALWQLWPEVLVLLLTTVVFFSIARYAARRWEFS